MRSRKMKFNWLFVGASVILYGLGCESLLAQQAKKLFTVADDIGVTEILGEGNLPPERFSPDGAYVAVFSDRGRVDVNQVEDSLRFYRTEDIKTFLARGGDAPAPIWVVNQSAPEGGHGEEDIISQWKWLSNSKGVAFLERVGSGSRLILADLAAKKVRPLTSASEIVDKFDVRDATHYVYTEAIVTTPKEMQAGQMAVVGTGPNLWTLILPDDPTVVELLSHRSYKFWAVVDGKRFEVKHEGSPILPGGELVLSPDGSSVVTTMPVPEVPKSWETLYPPPYPSAAWRIHAGSSGNQYVRLDLRTGNVQPLTDAPVSMDGGWDILGDPAWSSDGTAVVLPGTFLKSKDNTPSRPCVAVVDLAANARSCVEVLKARTATGVEEGFHRIFAVEFEQGDKNRVFVTFQKHGEGWFSLGTTEYRRAAEGTWQALKQTDGLPGTAPGDLQVTVKQAFNQSPLLVASNKETSRVVWDPNPQLKDLAWGGASLYTWKDREGRTLKGGLFKPYNYQAGHRYPLVIQTHGFDDSLFSASGSFPSAFAAGELASVGMLVLQAEDVADGCSGGPTPEEGPCAVSSYEAAANQLVSEGLADPENIGVIGFSRSCYYVMEALTTSSLRLKAASVTDGVMLGYFQTAQNFGDLGEAKAMIGAAPFGEGLQLWLKRSPGFNLDKVKTPLRVVGIGRSGLLYMWEPYAGLHYLKKPVDLIMLKAHAHVLTNPAERLAAQTGTVDWFRFWLQGYEDPDPAKAEQYKRWRGLREMQAENEKKESATSAASAR